MEEDVAGTPPRDFLQRPEPLSMCKMMLVSKYPFGQSLSRWSYSAVVHCSVSTLATVYTNDSRQEFQHLATTVLPGHMERLRTALLLPWSASIFSQPGRGVSSVVEELKLPSDFSGCYVLLDGDSPIYVGISRSVLKRLRQHFLGATHFNASLAYSMAKKRHDSPTKTRSDAMLDEKFRGHFNDSQTYLRGLSVGAITIEDPIELYLFEVYASMELKTSDWNSFRTH